MLKLNAHTTLLLKEHQQMHPLRTLLEAESTRFAKMVELRDQRNFNRKPKPDSDHPAVKADCRRVHAGRKHLQGQLFSTRHRLLPVSQVRLRHHTILSPYEKR